MSHVVEAVHENYAKNRRARILNRHFDELIPPNASVLDVGTGDGSIAASVQARRPDIHIEGVEYQVRDDCAIPVKKFDGLTLPFPDGSFDFVSFLDVLHHTEDPMVLLREAVRVARRGLIIKDHLCDGFLARPTLTFMDKVGNRRYGIELPNTYLSSAEWEKAFDGLGLLRTKYRDRLQIYPPVANWIFGRGLHFFARMELPVSNPDDGLEFWHEGLSCCNERWESAYNQFETPAEERAKFAKRFKELGIDRLDRSLSIVDVFCGRGNGLVVLSDLGFERLTGVDLSADLLFQAPSSVRRIVADCTKLKFDPESVDVFIVQGGLHHLPMLPDDLEKTLLGIHRALKPDGAFYVVEPWNTPFLRFVHWITSKRMMRQMVPRFDAFATMVEEEWDTYQQWLNNPDQVLNTFKSVFPNIDKRACRGKLLLVGRK